MLSNSLTTSDMALQPGLPHAACDALQHRGIACAQDSCSIACESACDDPDNCFLVNAVSSVPEGHTAPTLTLLSRQSTFLHMAPKMWHRTLLRLILTRVTGMRRLRPCCVLVDLHRLPRTRQYPTISSEALMRGPLRLFPPWHRHPSPTLFPLHSIAHYHSTHILPHCS